ncbi:MAG: hypothetical protein HYV07_17510 [Deltaproteobacteria bacterium]|nr:hypothetical protein [Deltaproteobacteria bacterium]
MATHPSARARVGVSPASVRDPCLLVWLIFAAPSIAHAAVPCEEAAKALVKRVEALPIPERAEPIRLAFIKDASLGCGVLAPRLFTEPVTVPPKCSKDAIETCVFEGGLPADPRAIRDMGTETYARVQVAASQLRRAGALSAAHERLFMTWMLSKALAGEAAPRR